MRKTGKIGFGTLATYVLNLNYLMSLAINRSSFTWCGTSLGFYFFKSSVIVSAQLPL